MSNFIQENIFLDSEKTSNKIQVKQLCNLIEEHPYKDLIYDAFKVNEIKDEYILVDFVDILHQKLTTILKKFIRRSIYAKTKDIDIYEKEILSENKIIFHFDEYTDVDEIKKNIEAIAIYNSKNSFLDQYVMTKYANNLFRKGLPELAHYNIHFFKELASKSDEYNKYQSYRLVENEGTLYLRGITSVNKYYEYGVDFVFVTSMLMLHKNMKLNNGTAYAIKSASINESKLEIIVSEKHKKDAGEFGKVSSAIKISVNDLGSESLNFTNIINVGKVNTQGFYLLPKKKEVENNRLEISHTTKPETVLLKLFDVESILNTSDKFIEEILDVKTIKTPDELRVKILSKIMHPNSSLKNITSLRDIFNRKIDNEIKSFAKLLDMCNKAEELNIEFDLKDKLRYIISDIILYGRTI